MQNPKEIICKLQPVAYRENIMTSVSLSQTCQLYGLESHLGDEYVWVNHGSKALDSIQGPSLLPL